MNAPITAAPPAQKPIDMDTFMEAVFEGHQETPILARNERDPTDPDAWDKWRTYRWRPGEKLEGCVYFGISTIRDDNPRATHPDRTTDKLAKTYVIPLDDVGDLTKTRVPPEEIEQRLPPSYKLESSEGNYQWGYMLEYPIEPAQAAAVLEALAAAGYTDAKAIRADRVMRVPGSIHLDKGGFKSRIIDWHPERLYSWATICQKLGITPGDTPKLSDGPAELPPGMVDPEFEWLFRNGYVTSTGPNRRGYWRVTCPQEHLHDPTKPIDRGTGYRPGKPSDFNCQHSHCKDFKMGRLRDWIREKDPAADLSPIPQEELQAIGAALAAQTHKNQQSALAARYKEAQARKGEDPAQLLAWALDAVPLSAEMLPSPKRMLNNRVSIDQVVSAARVHKVMAMRVDVDRAPMPVLVPVDGSGGCPHRQPAAAEPPRRPSATWDP